jgi:hypothetical protein
MTEDLSPFHETKTSVDSLVFSAVRLFDQRLLELSLPPVVTT